MSNPNFPPEACPPPLLWQDVRRQYLAQSRSLEIPSSFGSAAIREFGSGPPIYFLPAFAAPAELYCLLIWLLKEDFRCVTVEPGGHVPESSTGVARDQKPRPSRSVRACRPTMSDYVDLLSAAMDTLGDEVISLFGANFGAAWGLAAAHQLPARIARLMLLQGFAYRRLSFCERQLGRICGWSRHNLAAFPWREMFQSQNHRRWFPPFDATRWQFYLDVTGQMPLKELSRRAQAVSRFDLRPELKSVVAATLLIHTEGEGCVAEKCQAVLEESLPKVSAEWLHTTGQLAYLTHPHRLAKLMRDFCAEST